LALQQTTQQPRDLEQELVALWRQNAALHKENEFLRMRLEQRVRVTVKDYAMLRQHLDIMKDKVLSIFLDNPTAGFSHPEISELFRERFPAIRSCDIPRRTRELVREGLLWSRSEGGVAKFYLRLKEV
jgi:regulator of replication initiation timing